MKLRIVFSRLFAAGLIIAVTAMTVPFSANASEDDSGTPHYPLAGVKYADWSFAGPFGHWDIGQLQRGLKIYTEVCSACHSLDLISFRNLKDLGYSDEQVKAFAAEYEVEDGPNPDGEMYDRPAKPSDRFPGPYANLIGALPAPLATGTLASCSAALRFIRKFVPPAIHWNWWHSAI